MFVWDEVKNATNKSKHGLAFEAVYDFEWDHAVILKDDRADYGESRYRAFGLIEDRLHALIYTMRGSDIRIISLRRANQREEKAYETR